MQSIQLLITWQKHDAESEMNVQLAQADECLQSCIASGKRAADKQNVWSE